MKSILTLLLVCGLWLTARSQDVQVTDIRMPVRTLVKPILEERSGQSVGFYDLTFKDKVGGGKSEVLLQLFDGKQKLVTETIITLSNHSEVIDVAVNGETYLFAFNDPRKRLQQLVSIDKNGVVLASRELTASHNFQTDLKVISASQDAFYIARPIKEKTVGYRLEKVDKSLNILWEKQITPEKGYIGLYAIEAVADRILITQAKAPSFMSKQVLGQIVCLKEEDGTEVFTHDLYNGTTTAIPSHFLIDKDKSIVAGGMYLTGQKWWNLLNFDGVFLLKLSAEGKVMAYETTAWKDGIRQFLKDNTVAEYALGSGIQLYMQDLIEVEGGYRIIAETFRENIAVGARTLALMKSAGNQGYELGFDSGNTQPKTFEVLDLMLLQFDGQGKLSGIIPITKAHTKITLYEPYVSNTGLALAEAIKKDGFFDYAFTAKHPVSGNPVLFVRNLGESPSLSLHMLGKEAAVSTHTIPLGQQPGVKPEIRVGISAASEESVHVFSQEKYQNLVLLLLMKVELHQLFSGPK